MRLEYDVKNNADRECLGNLYHLILRIIRKPNTLIVLLLIQNIFKFLTTLPPRRPSLKHLPIFLVSVSEYSRLDLS